MNMLIFLLGSGLVASNVADAYRELSNAVVRLRRYSVGEEIEMKASVGTGFFVSYEGHLYLVSARHMKRAGDLVTEVNGRRLIIPRQLWTVHPLPGRPREVNAPDVAVARIDELPEGFRVTPLEVSGSEEDPDPVANVIVAGYPRDFAIDAKIQRPLLRRGIVAMTNDSPFVKYAGDQSLADSRVRVLDVKTFAGNSGSPVFRAEGFPARLVLVGLVSSGDEELGLAFAEPVSRIRETLTHAASAEVTQSRRGVTVAR